VARVVLATKEAVVALVVIVHQPFLIPQLAMPLLLEQVERLPLLEIQVAFQLYPQAVENKERIGAPLLKAMWVREIMRHFKVETQPTAVAVAVVLEFQPTVLRQ
jgi:hypothetical protein